MKQRNRRQQDRIDARAFLVLKYAPIALALFAWSFAAIEIYLR